MNALFPSTLQCVEIPENCAVPGGAATEGKAPKTARRKAGTTEDLDEEEEDDDEDEEEEVPPVPGQDLGEIFCIEETEVCDFLIRPGSELLLCKAGLERLLGPIAHAVLGHRRAFDAQISQEFSGELLREAAQRRAELNRARWSQDKSRLACRQPLPTASEKQLVFNFEAWAKRRSALNETEALRRILDHIYDHTTQMQRLTSEINSDSEDNSVLGSFVSSLPPIKPGSRGSARVSADDDDDDSKSSKSSKSEGASSTSSLTASSQMAPSLNPSLMRARDNSISDEEELHLAENPPARRRASLHWVELRQSAKLLLWAKQKRRRGVMASLPEMEAPIEAVTSSIRLEEAAPDHKLVHFEEGTVEPLRTAQRREWRPPTPHPQQSPEAARRTNPHKAKERFQKAARRGLKFDWLGWDS
ncbi:unnamed protein product [Effrenium voratum]|uniref:Uncharacterized protein n=1 Tax=Effrenium voratum TaxID=2562239 RepID=A0AA36NDJ8_9DINO|nr:unnamed protein product [Effrenium voratum]